MYKAIVTKKQKGYEIYMIEGPFTGKVVATVEKVQMECAKVVPGKQFAVSGRIRAAWGIEMIDTLDVGTVRSIGVGKTFKSLGNQLGQIKEGSLFCRTVEIKECGFLSLGSSNEVSFALHKV